MSYFWGIKKPFELNGAAYKIYDVFDINGLEYTIKNRVSTFNCGEKVGGVLAIYLYMFDHQIFINQKKFFLVSNLQLKGRMPVFNTGKFLHIYFRFCMENCIFCYIYIIPLLLPFANENVNVMNYE